MFGRDISIGPLWIHPRTLECALLGCVPCLYKMSPNGRLYDLTFPPNQRPELCLRYAKKSDVSIDRNDNINKKKRKVASDSSSSIPPASPSSGTLYSRGNHIMTVGDGDFSFSLSIAKQLLDLKHTSTQGKSDSTRLVATSHESLASIMSTYTTSGEILHSLHHDFVSCQVYHEVDATKLADTLPSTIAMKENAFDVICWNFPCVAAVEKAADGQVSELDKNKNLVREFFRSAKPYLTEKGEIHIAHKTIEPFCWWGIQELINRANEDSNDKLYYKGAVVFDKCLYMGYTNRKVLDKKSFPMHDAQVYIFSKLEAELPACVTTFGLIELSSEGFLEQTVVPQVKDTLEKISEKVHERKHYGHNKGNNGYKFKQKKAKMRK